MSTRRTSRRLIPFEMLGSSPSSVGPRLRDGGGGGAEAPDVGDSLRLRIVSSAILRSLLGVGRRDGLRVRGVRRREGEWWCTVVIVGYNVTHPKSYDNIAKGR